MHKHTRRTHSTKWIVSSTIALLLVGATLAALLTHIEYVTNFFSSANTGLSSAVGGSYNFNCITDQNVRKSVTGRTDSFGNCALMSDNADKQKCYESCRQTHSNSGIPTLNNRLLASKHLSYIKNYQPMYLNTIRGTFRKVSSHEPTAYARTNCSDIAANAVILLAENRPRSEFLLQTERLISIFDDAQEGMSESPNASQRYRGWAKLDYVRDSSNQVIVANGTRTPRGDFWLAPAAGYQCGIAASLLWDKFESNTAWDRYSNNPNRTAEQKRALIRSTLLQLARDVKSEYSATNFDRYMRERGPDGNSQLEELTFTSSFLAFMHQAFPKSGQEFAQPAKDLAAKAMTYDCSTGVGAFARCAYDSNFEVANHGIYAQPHYGLAGVMHMAWAGLPYYQWGGMNRDAIPSEFRFLSKSIYNLVNAFEGTAKSIDFGMMQYTGTFTDLKPTSEPIFRSNNWRDIEHQGRKGVTEWGMGPEYHAGAMTYMYVNDLYNYNGYRSSTGPIAWFIRANDTLMSQKKLYLAPKIGTTTQGRLTSTHDRRVGYPMNKTDNPMLENTHFMLNSFKAFEHVVSYLFVNDKTLLQKME